MQFPTDLYTYGQWSGYLTIALIFITILAFIFKWGLRFRLVGTTAFMGVLTAGIFSLYLSLFTRVDIPGSVRYSLVFDDAAANVVIVLSPETTQDEVTATLKQAALDIAPYGRLSTPGSKVTIRARTVIHPESGLSVPLYLGQAKKPADSRAVEDVEVEVFGDRFAQLPSAES